MSRSSSVIRPMPLRARVGARCEMRPPAPTQSTDEREYACWSKPAIWVWRSVAPAMPEPLRSIEAGKPKYAVFMFFYSCAIDFNVNVVVKPDKANEAVPAENGHDCNVAGRFQPPLEVFVNPRRTGRINAAAGMAVEVPQQAVTKAFQLNQQAVRGFGVAGNAANAALLVGKLSPLVEHEHAVHFAAGDKEKLLVPVSGQLLKALVQEQRRNRVALARGFFRWRGLADFFERPQEFIGLANLDKQRRQALVAAQDGRLGE